jgi:hypothetical protein
VAPTVEELIRTSALQTPPKYQSLEEYSRDFRQRERKLLRSIYATRRHLSTTQLPPPSPAVQELAKILGESRYSPTVEAVAKSLSDKAQGLGRVMEALRPKIDGLSTFLENMAQVAAPTLTTLRLRPPFLFAALDAWEAFLTGDVEAIDRFIVDRLGRPPNDRIRVFVQGRLEQAFGMDQAEPPRWADEAEAFWVAVFRSIRDEERATLRMVDDLREKVGKRASLTSDQALRYTLAPTYGEDPGNPKRWGLLKSYFLKDEFPGAVLLAWEERPTDEPLLPVQGRRGTNLLSRTTRIVKEQGAEAHKLTRLANKKPHVLLPDNTDGTRDLAAKLDLERFVTGEWELQRMREVLDRAGLSHQQQQVLDLKRKNLSDDEISVRLGRRKGHVAAVWFNTLAKITEAATA